MAACLNWLLFLVSVVIVMNRPGWEERHPPLRLMRDAPNDHANAG